MPESAVGGEDEAWIRAAHERAVRHRDRLATDGDAIVRQYGGQWVAFDGDQIVANAAEADELDQILEHRKVDRSSLLIRFIPPADWEFAF